MTVYLVRNLVDQRIYVGATTTTLRDRWNTHCAEAKTRAKWPIHLAIREFGRTAFLIMPLQTAQSLEELRRLEREWTIRLNATNPLIGYNVSTGYKLSPQTRARMRAARTGKHLSAAHRLACSKAAKGKPKSEAHKVALRIARRRWLSDHRNDPLCG